MLEYFKYFENTLKIDVLVTCTCTLLLNIYMKYSPHFAASGSTSEPLSSPSVGSSVFAISER